MEKILYFIGNSTIKVNNIFLIVVCLIILLLVCLIKNIIILNKKNVKSGIKIISKIFINSQGQIVLLDIKTKILVIGVTPNHMRLLYILPAKHVCKNHNFTSVSEYIMQNYMINFYKIFWKYIMIYRIILFFIFLLFCPIVYSLELPGLINHILPDGGQTWSVSMQTLIVITFLTLLPAFLLLTTSFTRIIIVFGLLRNALGTPYAPPNQVLLGIALFLTFFIMSPTFDRVYQEAYIPLSINKISMDQAIPRGLQPIREFMLHQVREADINLFSELAHTKKVLENKNDISMQVLIPSFITSELKTAFQIGFTILVPFLIIDLVVSSVLMALGMMMVPPSTISLPFKLILFVLADGWRLLFSSLVQSFY